MAGPRLQPLAVATRGPLTDGANRASPAIMAEALRQSGLLGAAAIKRLLAAMPTRIMSGDGTPVGEFRPVFRLAWGRR